MYIMFERTHSWLVICVCITVKKKKKTTPNNYCNREMPNSETGDTNVCTYIIYRNGDEQKGNESENR